MYGGGASPTSTRSASCRCRTPARGSRARSAASTTTPTRCRSNPCRVWRARRRSSRSCSKPFGWPLMFFNAKAGALTDPALRRAVLASLNFEDMLAAAFGSTDFYQADGAWYPEGSRSTAKRVPRSIQAAAIPRRRRSWQARQATTASRSGSWSASSTTSTSRWRRSRPNTCVRPASRSICRCSTGRRCSQRRNDPAVWEIFFTHGPILPEPTLYSFMNSGAPGWWATPARTTALAAFNGEPDPAKRAEHGRTCRS